MRLRLAVTILGLSVLGFSGTASADIPADCPENAKQEIGHALFARHSTSPCVCETIISCMNLDGKSATVNCHFFFPEVTHNINPGSSRQCGTGMDPNGIFLLDQASIAPFGSGFESHARVCASTKKMACDAVLSCSCAGGPVVSPIRFIKKKQSGD